jgi:acyl-CoA reductase-like NAD-dependent aldehyde dehydrogenase
MSSRTDALSRRRDRGDRVAGEWRGAASGATLAVTRAPIPFGGARESGLGREGGRYGFDEFTNSEFVCAAWKAA